MSIEKITPQDLLSRLSKKPDVMICSSSFEERCRTIPDCFQPGDFRQVLVVENEDLAYYVSENANYLIKKFEGKSKEILTKIGEPLITADNMQDAIKKEIVEQGLDNILVDITTFTHEALLILLQLLRIHCSSKKIWFTYAGTSEYSIGDKIEHKWLSRGVEKIRTVLGFPGENSPSRKTHLIVLVGYESERALNLIYEIEPHSISLASGKSGSETTESAREANYHFKNVVKEAAISYCGEHINTFDIYCDDPLKTKKAILEEVEKQREKNIVIAPMNNKITTLGAALAAIENPDIQIFYAQPIEYNYQNYSRPGNYCYLIELPELFENKK